MRVSTTFEAVSRFAVVQAVEEYKAYEVRPAFGTGTACGDCATRVCTDWLWR